MVHIEKNVFVFVLQTEVKSLSFLEFLGFGISVVVDWLVWIWPPQRHIWKNLKRIQQCSEILPI